jgi:hypothetical protein
MKKTTPKKLVLSRETLRYLTAEQTRAALGQGPYIGREPADIPWTSDSAKICCA